MYGSFGSYSSMSSLSAPMDISSGSLRSSDETCAFPSWPRRTSLSDDCHEHPTSYLSDDDLFPLDPFEDASDARSVSSVGSSSSRGDSPPASSAARLAETELLLELERERIAKQKEFVRQLVAEKERRRQAARKSRAHAAVGAAIYTSPRKSKLCSMTPIAEAGE